MRFFDDHARYGICFLLKTGRLVQHHCCPPKQKLAAGGEASSSAPGSETVLGRRERGEAFDYEAPTVMAEGGEASSSAPPAKRPRGTKSKPKKGGRKAKMGEDQRRDERNRERRE